MTNQEIKVIAIHTVGIFNKNSNQILLKIKDVKNTSMAALDILGKHECLNQIVSQ